MRASPFDDAVRHVIMADPEAIERYTEEIWALKDSLVRPTNHRDDYRLILAEDQFKRIE